MSLTEKLLPIFLLALAGFLFGRSKAFDSGHVTRGISNVAFYLFVPALLFRTTSRIDLASLEFRALAAFFVPTVLLMLIALVWLRLAMLLMAIFLGTLSVPPPSEFMQMLLFTPQGLGLLVVGTLIGGAIAASVFALSAVAVPLLLVEQTDAVTAARASLAAVCANPVVMMLWAALIVVMMGAGFLTLLIGLIVAFPLIGHATWYAYQDIYGETGGVAPP